MKLKTQFALLGALVSANFSLAMAQEDPVRSLPDVLVTATRTAHDVTDTPGASYVITREEMTSRNLTGIDGVVNTVPGVFDRRDKGEADARSSITLRGMSDQKRTLVLQDGMPLNDAYTGAVSFGGLPVMDYERVEVALGAGASLYGNNAMGGVVNLVTHMPDKREFTYVAGYGDGLGSDNVTHNLRRTYISLGDKLDNGVRLFASLGETHTNGYRTQANIQSAAPPAGIVGAVPTQAATGESRTIIGEKGSNEWSSNHAAIRAAYDLPQKGEVRLAYQRNAYEYAYGQPKTWLRDASGNEVYGYGSVREASFLEGAGARVRELYQASLETAVGSARLKLNAGINDSATNWYVTPGTSAATTRNGGPGTLTSTPMRLYFSDAQLTVTPTPNQVLVVGAAWRGESADTKDRSLSDWRNEETTGSTTYRAGGKSQTFAPFVQDEITFAEKFTATLGLRWDYWQAYDGYADSVGMAGYPMQYATRTEHELSPKLGLVYRANVDTSLRTSVGHAFRAPTVYELFRTRTTGGITYYSNPDLKPETVNSWDVGGDFHPWKGAAIKPTFYVYEVRDLIYRRTISSTEKEYINAGRAKGKGFELDYRQQLPHGWTVLAGGAINKTKIIENKASPDSEGKQFENVPERTGHLGVMWRQHAWSFTGLARYVSKRYAEDDNSDTTNNVQGSFDPYTVVDLKLGYQIDKNLKLALSIDNALNRDYYAYYQAPGRSYFVEVSGQF